MLEANRVIRNLLIINENNELIITKKETSGYPTALNRVLDKVGHYAVKDVNIGECKYYIVYDHKEYDGVPKSKILVCKWVCTPDFIKARDITYEDYENVLQIVRDYMKCTIIGKPKKIE